MKVLNSSIALRRDNDYNYAKVAEKFIPAYGEICLIDTARSGLRAVCGDGVTPFYALEYMDNLFIKGYYNAGLFYTDAGHTVLCKKNTNVLYIDIRTSAMYYFDGSEYKELGRGSIPTATS